MKKKQLVGVIWWPHSGGRWLCRSILGNHPNIYATNFAHPWIFNSTDKMMELDITSQVHKSRSLDELSLNLNSLVESISYGREAGLMKYFKDLGSGYEKDQNFDCLVGEICMGSPDPKYVDIEAVFKTCPDMKIIHLVRDPVSSYNSFLSRHEMDGDPYKIANSWVSLNSYIRLYLEENENLQENYLLVRYEDLINNLESEYLRMLQFIGIESQSNTKLASDKIWGKHTNPQIDPKIREKILGIVKEELNHYYP